jgi:hypothetical protein
MLIWWKVTRPSSSPFPSVATERHASVRLPLTLPLLNQSSTTSPPLFVSSMISARNNCINTDHLLLNRYIVTYAGVRATDHRINSHLQSLNSSFVAKETKPCLSQRWALALGPPPLEESRVHKTG